MWKVSPFVLLALLSCGEGDALKIKRMGQTDPVTINMASQAPDPTAEAAARFLNLSPDANNDTLLSSECDEDGCVFVGSGSGSLAERSQAKKRKKRLKKLRKARKKAEKEYMEDHSEEELKILEEQAIVDAVTQSNAESKGAVSGEGADETSTS
ncbi:uncharacterized protein LOC34619443 [Cyclospora cayetanensis]|uniref:Uncharacterized protein LOC34619443 n=1 Tax=Cyclospora cayetanensis TaxID=88456 RepID=A0A6P5WFK9_9EIME|nr:uncharacterized protein LOC34619443 [Cyclospora cayetanensis]